MRAFMGCPSLIVLLSVTVLGGCTSPQADSSIPDLAEASQATESGPIELAALAWPPVSTFERTCASCHGRGGSEYDWRSGRLNDEQLTEVVWGMMRSTGITAVSESDVRAMVAYCRALDADEPFICVTVFRPSTDTDGGVLQGEATLDAEVMLLTCGRCWTVAKENGFWELSSPFDRPELAAQIDQKVTELSLYYAQWSHGMTP